MAEPESLATAERLEKHVAWHSIDRLVMLSDGVFAIAITLAALEIRVPSAPTLSAVMTEMGVGLVPYLVSFVVIAVFWTGHRDLFARLRHVDRPLSALVLATLGLVALTPVSVRIATPSGGSLGGAFRFYAAVMLASGLTHCLQWAYSGWRAGLMSGEVGLGYRRRRVIETATLPLVFALVLVVPTVGMLKGVAVLVVVLLILRRAAFRWVPGLAPD